MVFDNVNFKDYETNVYNLADKLPQWNLDSPISRRVHSAVFSLMEETGEICGLISKKRIRKNYWNANTKDLSDFNDIREAFCGELSDLLWVLTCSCRSILGDFNNIAINIPLQFEKAAKNQNMMFNIAKADYVDTEHILEYFMSQLTNSIVNLYNTCNYVLIKNSGKNDIDDILYSVVSALKDVVYYFGFVLIEFNKDYSITLKELIDYNNSKLSKRYDSNGQRVDGK